MLHDPFQATCWATDGLELLVPRHEGPRFPKHRGAHPAAPAGFSIQDGEIPRGVAAIPRWNFRRVDDPANLDATSSRVNIQIARLTKRLATGKIDQCVFRTDSAGPDGIDPRTQFLGSGIGSPRQVRPEAAFAIRSVGSAQRRAVPGAVDWFDSAESPTHRHKRRQLPG